MQADHRVVGCFEQVGAVRQCVVEKQPVPFVDSSVHESHAQDDGYKPPGSELSDIFPAKCIGGEVNRQTAGKQTDREKDRDTENVLGHWAGEALADIKE